MPSLSLQNIPEGKEWLYEVKFDGYRCLAGRNSSKGDTSAHCHRGTERVDQKIPPVYHAIELPEIRIVFVSFKVPGSIASIRSNGRNKSA